MMRTKEEIIIQPARPKEKEKEQPFVNPCPEGCRYDLIDEVCIEI